VKAQHADWVRDRKVRVLLQAATAKAPDLSAVPLAGDFVRTRQGRQVLDFVLASQIMARPFAAPPGIPAERAAALRSGFEATMKDPAFLADARKLMLDVDPVTGEKIDALIAGLYATPKDVVAEATRVLVN
jgi:tripartite-type tricarboxylate transporter receptor subunit TctC